MIAAKTNYDAAMPKANIYLNGVTQRGGGSILFFDAQTAAITINSSSRAVYVNSSDQLAYWNGSTTTVLGSSGSLVSFTLDDAYDDKISVVAKSLLINGENPEVGNPQQAGYRSLDARFRAAATTEYRDALIGVMRQSELCV